jgi:hypothetical protein
MALRAVKKCVYCAVRTESSSIIQVSLLTLNGSYREIPNVVLCNLFRSDVLYIAYNPSA